MIGLRSARICMRSRDSGAEITLFPMVHLGEASFFRAVYEDAMAHDVVLVEGVSGPIARRITRSYRWVAGSSKLGLVLQSTVRPEIAGPAKVVHADLSPEEFAVAWRTVPILVRALVYLLGTLVALRVRWSFSRAALAKGWSMNDLTPDEELREPPELAALNRAILHTRDKRLLDHLDKEAAPLDGGSLRIAVVYGAAHMRAVVRHLTGRGYYAVNPEWLTVFSL